MAQDRELHEDFRRVRPALEGEVVRLRPRGREDLAPLNEMFGDPDVLAGLSQVTFPQPMAGIREWLERTRRDDTSVSFVIETLAGEPIGICSLESIEARSRVAALGIWIGREHWGRGYGTDATRAICSFGFRQMNLQRIGLHVFDSNERARRVYERVGFRHEGTLRRAHFLGGRNVDVHVMGILAEELVER